MILVICLLFGCFLSKIIVVFVVMVGYSDISIVVILIGFCCRVRVLVMLVVMFRFLISVIRLRLCL